MLGIIDSTWLQLGILSFLTVGESYVKESEFRASTIKAVDAVGYASKAQLERVAGRVNLTTSIARNTLMIIGWLCISVPFIF